MTFDILSILKIRNLSKKILEKSRPSSSHQLFNPTPAPIPMPKYPTNAILPCGCSRTQVLIQKLYAISLKPEACPAVTSAIISSSSEISLARADNDFEDNERQFHYYLPHISTSTTDFYTECDWFAFDIISPNQKAEMEAMLFDESSLDLPFIHEDDFNYYPEPAELLYRSSTEDNRLFRESARMAGEGRKIKKKRGLEEFWLKKKVARLVKAVWGVRIRRRKTWSLRS